MQAIILAAGMGKRLKELPALDVSAWFDGLSGPDFASLFEA